MAGIQRIVPAHIQEARDKHLDLPGAVLVTTGLMSLVYALTEATQKGWSAAPTVICLTLFAVLILAFLWNETKAKHPLVPLSIFRIRNVSGANLVMLPVMAGALGMFFFVSQYVQNILHFSPLKSGFAFLPVPIIIGLLSNRAPRLLMKFGFKRLMVVGIGLVAIGTFLMSFLTERSGYWTGLLPPFLFLALGFGVSFIAVTVAATSGVPGNEAGLASGLINTSQQVGGAVGLAVLAVIANASTKSSLASGQPVVTAIVHGYQKAFLGAALLVVFALVVAVSVIRTPKMPAAEGV